MVDLSPAPTEASAGVKPGWKSTEFYFAIAAFAIGAAYASGAVVAGTPLDKVLGLATVLLTSLGYTVSRTLIKK